MNDSEFAAGRLSEPVDFSSAQFFGDSETLADTHESKYQKVRYGRDSGHGQINLEKSLELWHPGFRALTFRSGMGALHTLLQWGWGAYKDHFVQSEVYRKTSGLIRELSELSGKSAHLISLDTGLTRSADELLPGKSALVVLEVPSNPHLRIPDWPTIAPQGDEKPFVLVDATMSGLGNLSNELIERSDAIAYSLTKYIGGHNDLIGGALFVRPDLYEEIWEVRSRMGNIIGPMEAFLALRSLKTFDLRWQRQCDVAEDLFTMIHELFDAGSLRSLNFPGTGTNSDQAQLSDATMMRKGAVMSFEVNLNREDLSKKMSDLETVKMAPSFGSTDSLIEICSLMSQPEASYEELAAMGIEPSLVRLSVGVEKPELIFADIRRLV